MRTGRSRKSPSPAKSRTSSSSRAIERVRQAVVQAAQHDVLAPGQIDVHAEIGVEQRIEAALHAHDVRPPARRCRPACAAASSCRRRWSRPAPAGRRCERERDVAQRLHHHAALLVLAKPAGGRRDHRLLQAAAVGVIQREIHRRIGRLRPARCAMTAHWVHCRLTARTATRRAGAHEHRPRDHAKQRAVDQRGEPDGDRGGLAEQRRAHHFQQGVERVERHARSSAPTCSAFQITGVMKNAICMTLATIGPMSRNRAQNAPSNRHKAIESTIQSASPGRPASARASQAIRGRSRTPPR